MAVRKSVAFRFLIERMRARYSNLSAKCNCRTAAETSLCYLLIQTFHLAGCVWLAIKFKSVYHQSHLSDQIYFCAEPVILRCYVHFFLCALHWQMQCIYQYYNECTNSVTPWRTACKMEYIIYKSFVLFSLNYLF